jgi:hypothetical protein
MKQLLIKFLLKVGSDLLINFLKRGAEELEKRDDNNFQSAGEVKKQLEGVEVGKK